MVKRPGGGKAKGASAHSLTGKTRHFGDLGLACVFAVSAALTHDEHPQRRMRQLRPEIDVEGFAGKAI